MQTNARIGPLAVLAVVLATSLFAQTTPPKTGASKMKEFAFLYRQGPRKLTDEDKQHRTDQVRAWAIGLADAGRLTYSRIMGGEGHRTPNGYFTENDNGEAVAAFTIVQAASIEDAFKLAKTWPGIEFGGSVEVREAHEPVRNP